MENLFLLLVMLALFVAGAWALAVWQRGRLEASTAALRAEIQSSSVQSHVQALANQLGQLVQTVNQQLAQLQQAVQQGVTDSGMLSSKATDAVAAELKESREVLGQIRHQLGQVYQAGQELSKASQTMQQVLGGAKTRGTLGELSLERLLEDSLPAGSFEIKHRFSTGGIVDAVVRAGDKFVAIDSKFPLDAYRRLVETGEEARKEFAQDVRRHADSIASKYILPEEGTLDNALMFVPSETVFYELLMTEDARSGRLDEYCRQKGVVPVSPNTLHAYLSVILLGLRGMQVEENARQLLSNLAGLERQIASFGDTYEKLGTHLRHAQQSYDEADKKLDRARAGLDQMVQGALPEAAPPALEPAEKE